jgi:hypothetical protein
MLTSSRFSVIEHLSKEKSTNETSAPVAYFYCARNTTEPERANPDEILRSILKQLSCSKTDLPIREPIATRYQELKEEAENDGCEEPAKLTATDCEELILSLLDINPATIIIDALDECDPAGWCELLLAFDRIIQNSTSVIKLFVSSRDNHDIVCRLKNSPNIFIRASDNGDDINRFIHSRVDQSITEERLLSGNVSEKLRSEIITTLTNKAQGM